MKKTEILKQLYRWVNNVGWAKYDITMCDNQECSKHQHCHRYVTYQEYKQDKKHQGGFNYMYGDTEEKCAMYWSEKEYKKNG